jgi:threonine dehydratase
MACLAAGEVSPAAWAVLRTAADDVLALPDEAAEETMRALAAGIGATRRSWPASRAAPPWPA